LYSQIKDIKEQIKQLNLHRKRLKKGEYPTESDIPEKMPKDVERTKVQIDKAKERLAKWEIKKIEKVPIVVHTYINTSCVCAHLLVSINLSI